ncbi:hypothetical protein H8K33_08130 [Undibacterium amnicola]|uniref:Uncharacterized protein n=1 Tax=Undibacterium amnicola TaxID=1834038 RepID=A0ABR6XR25_9BURK|nr:hypothetical protein [Undibacterium amnicola]MBC3831474.1 hypothetical protein [Undibacterium amnicola]
MLSIAACGQQTTQFAAASGQVGIGSKLSVTGDLGEIIIPAVPDQNERKVELENVKFNDPLQPIAATQVL